MKTKLTTRFKNKLRDPIWGSISVFVAFTALVATLLLSNLFLHPRPNLPNRLMFSWDTAKDLTDFPEPVSKRLQIFVDGKEERGLRLFIFRLEYKGDQPMRASDFEIPIMGRVPNNRKIVGVQKSPNLEGPTRYNRQTETITLDTHPPVNFDVNVPDSHAFDSKTLLMHTTDCLGEEIDAPATE